MSWSTDDIPDQSGKTAVVTGATSGLGLVTAQALAARGAHVIMAVRNLEKARAAQEDIQRHAPDSAVQIVVLDLTSLASVREAAAEIRGGHDRVDILINNAGIMAVPQRRTADGFELQLGVNHLGHWALTAHLLPSIIGTEGARVVTVTSTAHLVARRIDPQDPHLEGGYGPWRAYGRSKLANYHFGLGLQREFQRAGVAAHSLIAHPGLSDTQLQTTSVHETGGGLMSRFWRGMAASTGMSPEEGALSQLRAATDPDATGGEFYGPLFVNNGPPVRKPVLRRLGMDRAIRTLWEVSERETGLRIDVAAAAAS